MPGGGKLFLETSIAMVEADFAAECLAVPPGKYVVIAAADTGIGMTPEVQARIFEPFYTTKGQEGTGLGLSTTYGIIKQSGGCITVHSTPGFGTTFKVYLPAVQIEAAENPSLDAFDSPARGSETILVVEDQEEVRRFMRDTLGGHGYHTLEASACDEAIRIALLPCPDSPSDQRHGAAAHERTGDRKPRPPHSPGDRGTDDVRLHGRTAGRPTAAGHSLLAEAVHTGEFAPQRPGAVGFLHARGNRL